MDGATRPYTPMCLCAQPHTQHISQPYEQIRIVRD